MKNIIVVLALFGCVFSTHPVSAVPDIDKVKQMYHFSEWPGKENRLLLPRVNLTREDIPALRNASQKEDSQKHYTSWFVGGEHVITYQYLWAIYSVFDVEIRMTVGGACGDAHEFLLYRFATRSSGTLSTRDVPAVAGDISFDKGTYFIRNNVAFEIYADGQMRNMRAEIARQVDEILLKQPFLSMDSSYKPVVTNMEFIKWGVRKAKIVPSYYDPLGGKVTTDIFCRNVNESFDIINGEWYYSLYQPNSSSVVTILFINERGFNTAVKLNITATENDIFRSLRGER